jgi:hypothetical protein
VRSAVPSLHGVGTIGGALRRHQPMPLPHKHAGADAHSTKNLLDQYITSELLI